MTQVAMLPAWLRMSGGHPHLVIVEAPPFILRWAQGARMTNKLYYGDNPNIVRDLGRVMERDRHRFGLFVMKSLPTKGMRYEAASQPTIETEFGRFPALQFVTLAELFMGLKPKLPPLIRPVKKASRVETRVSHKPGSQGNLL
jgi:hypothetical protein